MKFKIDENLPREAVEILASAGHDAISVFDQGLNGKPDPDVFRAVSAEGRVLVTLDVGFGNIREYPPASSAGVIVFRLARQGKPAVLAAIESLVPTLSTEPIAGKLWIVEEGRLRIRG